MLSSQATNEIKKNEIKMNKKIAKIKNYLESNVGRVELVFQSFHDGEIYHIETVNRKRRGIRYTLINHLYIKENGEIFEVENTITEIIAGYLKTNLEAIIDNGMIIRLGSETGDPICSVKKITETRENHCGNCGEKGMCEFRGFSGLLDGFCDDWKEIIDF